MRFPHLQSIFTLGAILMSSGALAQGCPEQPPLNYYTGSGSVVCPCFVSGEEAGVAFSVPAEMYPIQILRVGIGWGSQIGGSGEQVEQAIHIYGAGFPGPGIRLYTLPGPALTDGAINEFNLETQLGTVIINSGSFTVTLEFMNDNAGDPFAPSVVHDGNGCQAGRNVVKAIPGGWFNACALGVSGDWVFYVIYRPVNCSTGIGEEYVAASGAPAFLWNPQPNPFSSTVKIDFYLANEGHARLNVYNVAGRRVATVADCDYARGRHSVTWDGKSDDSRRVSAGVYFLELQSDGARIVQKMVMAR